MPGAVPSRNASRLPGFGLSLGITILWLSLIVLIPLSAVFIKSVSEGWNTFWTAAGSPRAMAAYRLSFGAAALAAAGPRARLIATRTVSQDRTATAAIAEGDDA